MNFIKKTGGLIVIILLFSLVLVSAKTEKITLNAGESYELEGKRVSLVRSTEDFMIVCINGDKQIIKKDEWNNGVYFDLINLERDQVTIKIKVDCKEDCDCDESCDNSECLGIEPEEVEEQETEESNQETTEEPIPAPTGEAIRLPQTVSKPTFTTTMIIVTVILILLIVFLGSLLLRRKRQ